MPGKTDDERSAESVATYTPTSGDEFGAVAFAQFVAKHKASDRIVVAPGNYSVSVGYPGHSHIVLGGGSPTGPLSNLEIDFTAVFLLVRRTQLIPPVLSLFTLLRPYLAHFCPVFPRFLRVFTVSTRRFQRAPSRNPGPRNSSRAAERLVGCLAGGALQDNIDETISTLKFAERAKTIKNAVVKMEVRFNSILIPF